MEALQLGSVQMLAPSLAKFGPLGVRDFEVFDLPYIFDNYEELHKVTNGPVGAALMKKLEPKGIVGLAYWDNGFKVMSANRPIRAPADYKGLKMRIQSSKVLGDEIKALGAIPQVMAFSEVYQALQTGVVDGTENPPSNFYTQKMHEVQKFLALTDHGYLGYAVIANKKFWDGLPPDIRATLEGAMSDATKFANEIAKKENDDALEAVRKSGKTEILALTPEQKAALKKALVVVHKENAARVGKETIADVYKATGFQP
jgi:C4-dicarboxylate-binding protein DctP